MVLKQFIEEKNVTGFETVSNVFLNVVVKKTNSTFLSNSTINNFIFNIFGN
jgi:hypothetical protein